MNTRVRVATATRRLALAATTAAALAIAALPALAQQRGDPGRRGPEAREQLEQRIRAQMGRMMRERLDLTEQQAEVLAQVVQGFDERRRELFREEQATRRRVGELLDEREPDEAEAAALVARMAELRRSEAQLFTEEQQALSEVLSPMQVLELHELREQIGRRIRALRGGRDDEPGRRRGRGGDQPDGPWADLGGIR
jgi:Spy/CpxP family protein refolding chaperone